VSEGLAWARRCGWKDTYTFTKSMGEQLFVRHKGDVPALILRPSIIESALRTPAPGWIDGFRMMDPLIVGYGRGQLREFPGSPEALIDVVPADTVVNALLAAIPWTHNGNGGLVYQVASGMEKPLLLKNMRSYIEEYFQKMPLRRTAPEEGNGGSSKLPRLTFPAVAPFLRRLRYRYLLPLRLLEAAHVPLTITEWGKRRHASLRARRSRVRWLHDTASIYGPYAENRARFLTYSLRPMWEALPEEDRAKFPFLLDELDWKNYVQEVHVPGIERYLLRMRRRTEDASPSFHAASEPAESAGNRSTPTAKPVLPADSDETPRGWERAGKIFADTRDAGPDSIDVWATPLYKKVIRRSCGALMHSICRRRLSLECEGTENIPERGPFILVANHTSHVDTGVLLSALGPLATQAHPTAAADYWYRSRIIAWLLQVSLGAIPFDRHARNIPRALGLPAAVLHHGHSLIFYPEGSRSTDGEMRPFKSTLGLLALVSGAPVLPAYITGASEALPKGDNFIKRHPVRVRFGPVTPVDPYLRRLDHEKLSTVAHQLAEDVQVAVEELRGPKDPAPETAWDAGSRAPTGANIT